MTLQSLLSRTKILQHRTYGQEYSDKVTTPSTVLALELRFLSSEDQQVTVPSLQLSTDNY